MTAQPEALRLAQYFEGFNTSGHVWHDGQPLHLAAAAELRRLHEVNQQLLDALRWIDSRCPVVMVNSPLHEIHREIAHDAGACARAALTKVQEKS